MEFSHLDQQGNVKMVNTKAKQVVSRYARASGMISLKPATIDLIKSQSIAKGNVLTTAKIAAIAAAKQTSTLIPLTHNIYLDGVEVQFEFSPDGIKVFCEVWSESKTGVEMEALTGCAVALLTIYDMCKAVDREMVITELQLLEKRKDEI